MTGRTQASVASATATAAAATATAAAATAPPPTTTAAAVVGRNRLTLGTEVAEVGGEIFLEAHGHAVTAIAGGGAILHDDEITYSLIVPLLEEHSYFDSIENLYRLAHDAFIAALVASLSAFHEDAAAGEDGE